MKYWLIKVPFKGKITIPIKSENKPDIWDSEISSNLHTGFFDDGIPTYYRQNSDIEETNERNYNSYLEVANKRFKRKSNIITKVMKEAGLVEDISRILKLDIDDQYINKVTKFTGILNRLELKAKSVLHKNQINDVKNKIEKSMELLQEANEDLFNLQQQLINEENSNLLDKE